MAETMVGVCQSFVAGPYSGRLLGGTGHGTAAASFFVECVGGAQEPLGRLQAQFSPMIPQATRSPAPASAS